MRRAYVEMAKWKFGADVAERLADMLAGVTDHSRLARVGRLVLECETGDELIGSTTKSAVKVARSEVSPTPSSVDLSSA